MRRRILTARPAKVMVWVLLAVFVVPPMISFTKRLFAERPHWGEASHATTGQAPTDTPHAVVQVYAARTWGLRGSVAVHTWLATRRAEDNDYRRHEVIGWRLRRTGSALVQADGRPDAQWFSNYPELLVDLRGEGVGAVIDKIEAAIEHYPYAREYRTWPGPNSNTFTAYVGRRVPELGLHLPPTAIGKDFLPGQAVIGKAPSGTGVQFSLLGLTGVIASPREGVEVNLLGLVAGLHINPVAVKLPGLGTWLPLGKVDG